jgi:hypothetical protein
MLDSDLAELYSVETRVLVQAVQRVDGSIPLMAGRDALLRVFVVGNMALNDYRPPARVPAPPSPQDAGQWATGLGAVHGGSTIVEAIVRGEGPGAVVVEALYVRITEREQPLDWPAYEMSMGCGGSLTPAAFTVALDAGRPLARPRGGFDGESGEAGSALPAPELPYQVTQNEPLVRIPISSPRSTPRKPARFSAATDFWP